MKLIEEINKEVGLVLESHAHMCYYSYSSITSAVMYNYHSYRLHYQETNSNLPINVQKLLNQVCAGTHLVAFVHECLYAYVYVFALEAINN